jgi:predicted RNA methylase
MSHTEEFNRIMNRTNTAHKEKTMQKKIVPVLIGGGDNMNELQTSIAKCRIGANVVYLPNIKEGILSNYADVRKAFLNAGATYKNNTFIFPNDAKPYIDRLMGGESVNIKKEFQFFATPKELAEEMAAFTMKDFDCQTMTILEPSAGQGALVKACFEHDFKDELIVHGYELMDVNRSVLAKIKDFVLLGEDFLKEASCRQQFDRIIANPPFNKNQDIDHIRKMYEVCKTGGRIVTIASNSWRLGSQKKQVEFREWLDNIGAVVEDVEAGTFKESGTNIATCIIVIDK